MSPASLEELKKDEDLDDRRHHAEDRDNGEGKRPDDEDQQDWTGNEPRGWARVSIRRVIFE